MCKWHHETCSKAQTNKKTSILQENHIGGIDKNNNWKKWTFPCTMSSLHQGHVWQTNRVFVHKNPLVFIFCGIVLWKINPMWSRRAWESCLLWVIVLYGDKRDAVRECKTTIEDVIGFAFLEKKRETFCGISKLCMIVCNKPFPNYDRKTVSFPCIINEELLQKLIMLRRVKINKYLPVKLLIMISQFHVNWLTVTQWMAAET